MECGVSLLTEGVEMIRTIVEQHKRTIASPHIYSVATGRVRNHVLHLVNNSTIFLSLRIKAALDILVNLLESVSASIVINQRRVEFGLGNAMLLEHQLECKATIIIAIAILLLGSNTLSYVIVVDKVFHIVGLDILRRNLRFTAGQQKHCCHHIYNM